MSGVVRDDLQNRTFRPLFFVMGIVRNTFHYETHELKNSHSIDDFTEEIVNTKKHRYLCIINKIS